MLYLQFADIRTRPRLRHCFIPDYERETPKKVSRSLTRISYAYAAENDAVSAKVVRLQIGTERVAQIRTAAD
jgi:hypothetical protein